MESCKLVTMAGISVELATQGEGEASEAIHVCSSLDTRFHCSTRPCALWALFRHIWVCGWRREEKGQLRGGEAAGR